jgi:hypothetical protein
LTPVRRRRSEGGGHARNFFGRHHRDHLPKKAPRSQIEDKAIIAIEILSLKWLAGRKVADIHFSDMEQLRATGRNLPSVVIYRRAR